MRRTGVLRRRSDPATCCSSAATRGQRITHVAFAGEDDTLVHSTLACGGMVQEPWLPGSRAASLRELLVAVRRLEER